MSEAAPKRAIPVSKTRADFLLPTYLHLFYACRGPLYNQSRIFVAHLPNQITKKQQAKQNFYGQHTRWTNGQEKVMIWPK